MKFNNEQGLSINRDRLFVPICDRWLPNHPKERYGKLPYWYFRTRFRKYGMVTYDLPFRQIRRRPEHNEQMWYRTSNLNSLVMEKFFYIGALLPFHPIFFEANPPLKVKGEKIDLTVPYGVRWE